MTEFRPPDLPQAPDVANHEWGEVDKREVLAYDAGTGTYWARARSDTESVVLDIVSVVAVVSDTRPMDLPPLYYDVDPNAFDALADLTTTEASIGEMSIAVTYTGCDVTVHADGTISVRPPPAESTDEP